MFVLISINVHEIELASSLTDWLVFSSFELIVYGSFVRVIARFLHHPLAPSLEPASAIGCEIVAASRCYRSPDNNCPRVRQTCTVVNPEPSERLADDRLRLSQLAGSIRRVLLTSATAGHPSQEAPELSWPHLRLGSHSKVHSKAGASREVGPLQLLLESRS